MDCFIFNLFSILLDVDHVRRGKEETKQRKTTTDYETEQVALKITRVVTINLKIRLISSKLICVHSINKMQKYYTNTIQPLIPTAFITDD